MPNHYASDAIGHCICSQFIGPYHHYDAMIKEDKLKWWTDFKVILIFNYNFIQINKNGKIETKYFLYFNWVKSLKHLRMSDRLKRSMSLKSKHDFVTCWPKLGKGCLTYLDRRACMDWASELLGYTKVQR